MGSVPSIVTGLESDPFCADGIIVIFIPALLGPLSWW